MIHRILFVCLGNICRSPSAEAVLRAKAAERGLTLEIDSAGTADWHLGKPPYRPMQSAAKSRGYDLSALRARQATRGDFDAFDLVLAMDGENLAHLRRMRPQTSTSALKLFTDFAPASGMDHVPDPYFTRDFVGCLDLIEEAAEGLLNTL